MAIEDSANAITFNNPNITLTFEPPPKIENILGKLPPSKITPIGVKVKKGNRF